MKKKIMLHIIMPNQVSGPNNSAKRIAESYLNQTYDFCYLTQHSHAGGRINFRLIIDLMKQIRKYDPDLLHLSGLQSSGFHAVIAARLAGYSNIFLTVRGFAFDTIDISILKKIIFKYFIEPLTLVLSKKISLVTKESLKKRMIRGLSTNKLVGIIHNAAPEPISNIPIIRENQRKKFGFNEDDFIIIIVGRMVYDKGVSYIAEAARKLKKDNLKFVYIGVGPYSNIIKKEYSKEIAEGTIHLLGKQKNVMKILTMADVFLFATLHENLSNALLEAMTVGLPVICTNVGGNLEVIEDRKNGLFIEPENSFSIVQKIEELYYDSSLRSELSKNAKKTIEDNFSQSIIYRKINEIYEQMLID